MDKELLIEIVKNGLKNTTYHQVGNFGSEETCKDEHISKLCMTSIFDLIKENRPIEGYHFELESSKILLETFAKKFGVKNCELFERHGIDPDLPTLFLVNDENPNERFPVCSGEDKFQNTGGNAIERVAKNYNFFNNFLTCDTEINPYAVFCCGGSFVGDDNKPKNYFHAKLIQTFNFKKNGFPNINWDYNTEHSINKNDWNLVFVKKERFTVEEKINILVDIIQQSIEYYKSIL